ncbi:MAG: DegT/DnrJ/EryC1/StrS family aminotransferase [Candidatus Heimdallarchaeota archaeon]
MKVPAARILFPEEDRKEILANIDQILKSGQLTLGSHGKNFEKEFAGFLGSKHAIAVNSGTSALEIPLRVLGINTGNVIVPTNTFFATPAAVLHSGANIKFVDIEWNSLGIDVEKTKEAIDSDTKGIIIVHIGGIISPQIHELREICDDQGLFLIEDAAHAHGSTLSGKYAGTFGHVSSFSFYPTKVITSGEGGMIVTDQEDIVEKSRIFRDQGKSGFLGNIHVEMGYNWRMSEIHALLGRYQLQRLNEFVDDRKKIAKLYDDHLPSVSGIKNLNLPADCNSNYYKYIAFLDNDIDRTQLKKELRDEFQISLSGEVYELPCHVQPVFKGLGYGEGDFPIAEEICKRQICLPLYARMTREEGQLVIDALKEILA